MIFIPVCAYCSKSTWTWSINCCSSTETNVVWRRGRFIRKLITDIAEMRDHLALTDYTLTVHEQSEEEIIKYLEELQERRIKLEKELKNCNSNSN